MRPAPTPSARACVSVLLQSTAVNSAETAVWAGKPQGVPMTKPSKSSRDNRANQLNPTHPSYHRSRGSSEGAAAHQASTTARAKQAATSPSKASSHTSRRNSND